MQVDPIKPTVKAPGTKRLKLKYAKLLSSFAFNVNLRRYSSGAMAIKSAVVQDHLKSYVYIEAEREDNVKRALQGMRHVYHSKPPKLVPIKAGRCRFTPGRPGVDPRLNPG